MVRALTEVGLTDLALEEWAAMSLRNHARFFPQVSYGVLNGPDCYSSHFAGARKGCTQLQLIDGGSFTPMNPVVAWGAFAMRKLLRRKQDLDQGDATNYAFFSSLFHK